MKNWRKMLEEIGGYDNEFVAVPAGTVCEMVEEIERLRNALAEITPAFNMCRTILQDQETRKIADEIVARCGALLGKL